MYTGDSAREVEFGAMWVEVMLEVGLTLLLKVKEGGSSLREVKE